MRFVGKGDPRIRASHSKTLEVSAERAITERATCIVAVDARPDPPAPLAGPVRITITATTGERTLRTELTAHANPLWEPGGAVIRRSPLRLPGTFATSADVSAADLPRDLVAALADERTAVELTVAPEPSPRTVLVLVAADPARPLDAALRAEAAAAGRVVAQDVEARKLLRGLRPGQPSSGRVLVVATRELPGADLTPDLADSETSVETLGLPPALAAAAASPTPGPLVLAPPGSRPADVLATASGTSRVVVSAPAAGLAALLEAATAARPGVPMTLAQLYAPPMRVAGAEPPALPRDDTVYCCVGSVVSSSPGSPEQLEPAVRRAIAGLLEDGVATRAAARALGELTGLPRRAAYELVLRMSRGR